MWDRLSPHQAACPLRWSAGSICFCWGSTPAGPARRTRKRGEPRPGHRKTEANLKRGSRGAPTSQAAGECVDFGDARKAAPPRCNGVSTAEDSVPGNPSGPANVGETGPRLGKKAYYNIIRMTLFPGGRAPPPGRDLEAGRPVPLPLPAQATLPGHSHTSGKPTDVTGRKA